MNPATFLRVLGPEPWNVAYVEPSIRPDDCRYRDNPYQAAAAHSVSVECVCVFVCMCVCVCMCRGVGDDSRYRDNPYRLQRHTQFQVSVFACLCVCACACVCVGGLGMTADTGTTLTGCSGTLSFR